MDYELNLVPCDETIVNDVAKEKIIISIGDFIHKLIMLEERLGSKVYHRFLEPQSLKLENTYDNDELDRVANEIARFLRLRQRIHVNIDNLPHKVGGNIALTSDYDITINVEYSLLKIADSVLAVLAHELTHLYLFNHTIDLSKKSVLDNELLTDIAAIYLGLGKLILNGHRTEKKYEVDNKEYTYKLHVGYVKTHYLGFVYKTICDMRNIPENVYNENLSPQGKIYITQAMTHNEFSNYLNKNFYDENIIKKTLANIKEIIHSIQIILSDIEKYLKNDEIRSAKEIEPFLINTHKKIHSYLKICSILTSDTDLLTECLKYLYNMKLYQVLEEILVCFDTDFNLAKSYLKYLVSINTTQSPDLNVDPESNTCTIVCRNDNTKIQYSIGKPTSIVKCPKCGYQFVASTDSLLHNEEVKDFVSLYKEHFAINAQNTEPIIKLAEDKGFIEPFLRYLFNHPLLVIGIMFIIIGLLLLADVGLFGSLMFFAIGIVLMICGIFNLSGIRLQGNFKHRYYRRRKW